MAAPSTLESVSRRSSRYLLPIAGGTALTLGSLALAGLHGGFDRYLPAASVGVGVVTLWASLTPGVLARSSSRAIEVADPWTHERADPSAKSASPAAPAPPRATPNPRSAPVDKKARRRVPSVAAQAGDELWGHWETPKTSLGAALVGPVAQTAYSPSHSGAVAPWGERDRDVQFLSDLSSPSKATPALSRTDDIAVRPTVAAPSVPPEGPRNAGASSPSPFRDLGTYFGGSVGLLPLLDALDFESSAAAEPPARAASRPKLNPRAQEWLDRVSGEHARRPFARLCSDCSRRLVDFREWVHCRKCRDPVCKDCLSESFSTDGRGLCSDCRETQNSPRTLSPGPSTTAGPSPRMGSVTGPGGAGLPRARIADEEDCMMDPGSPS